MKAQTKDFFNDIYTLSKGRDLSFKAGDLLPKLSSVYNKSTLKYCLKVLQDKGFIKYDSSRGRGKETTVHFLYKGKLDDGITSIKDISKAKVIREVKKELTTLKAMRRELEAFEKRTKRIVRDYCLEGVLSGVDVLKIKRMMQTER